MSLHPSFKLLVASAAVFLFSFSTNSHANAQGFRIGNVIQAGGGQGFRMGFPRAGMHFGGGQGATIGTPNFGMRFGNGQGARFGGTTYGMQFGGQQGTQIGQFSTTPAVTPGTYYYGDVRGNGIQPGTGQPLKQPIQPTIQPTIIQPGIEANGRPAGVPTPADPDLSRTKVGGAATLPTLSAPAPTALGNGTQLDLAAAATAKTETRLAAPANVPTLIRLKHPITAKLPIDYTLNGTAFSLAPGESVIMQTGQKWLVTFSAGESFGRRQAELVKGGTFFFFETPDEGWILAEEALDIKLNAPAVEKVKTKK